MSIDNIFNPANTQELSREKELKNLKASLSKFNFHKDIKDLSGIEKIARWIANKIFVFLHRKEIAEVPKKFAALQVKTFAELKNLNTLKIENYQEAKKTLESLKRELKIIRLAKDEGLLAVGIEIEPQENLFITASQKIHYNLKKENLLNKAEKMGGGDAAAWGQIISEVEDLKIRASAENDADLEDVLNRAKEHLALESQNLLEEASELIKNNLMIVEDLNSMLEKLEAFKAIKNSPEILASLETKIMLIKEILKYEDSQVDTGTSRVHSNTSKEPTPAAKKMRIIENETGTTEFKEDVTQPLDKITAAEIEKQSKASSETRVDIADLWIENFPEVHLEFITHLNELEKSISKDDKEIHKVIESLKHDFDAIDKILYDSLSKSSKSKVLNIKEFTNEEFIKLMTNQKQEINTETLLEKFGAIYDNYENNRTLLQLLLAEYQDSRDTHTAIISELIRKLNEDLAREKATLDTIPTAPKDIFFEPLRRSVEVQTTDSMRKRLPYKVRGALNRIMNTTDEKTKQQKVQEVKNAIASVPDLLKEIPFTSQQSELIKKIQKEEAI